VITERADYCECKSGATCIHCERWNKVHAIRGHAEKPISAILKSLIQANSKLQSAPNKRQIKNLKYKIKLLTVRLQNRREELSETD